MRVWCLHLSWKFSLLHECSVFRWNFCRINYETWGFIKFSSQWHFLDECTGCLMTYLFFSNRFPWGINVWIFSFFLLSALKIISSCQLEIISFAWFLSSFSQLSIAYRLTKIMEFSFFFFHLSWILQYFARLDESSKCILFDFSCVFDLLFR